MSCAGLTSVGLTSGHNDHSKREKINEHDVDSQLHLEQLDTPGSYTPSLDDVQAQQTIVCFHPGDPDNPHNWSARKKILVVVVGIATVMNSTIASSIASGATNEIQAYFHLTNQADLVLPTSIYLVGYVVGPLVFSPLSESYGRKWVMIGTFVRT